jgi:hypothetical protein
MEVKKFKFGFKQDIPIQIVLKLYINIHISINVRMYVEQR